MKRLILSLAMVAAIAACSKGASTTPGGTVEEFARRLDAGNCNIKELLTKSSRDMAGDKLESMCKLGVEERKNAPDADQQRLKAVNILEAKEEGDRATVRAETESNAGQKSTETFTLVREEGSWRIDLLAGARSGPGGPAGPDAPVPAPADMTPPAAPPAATPAPTGAEAPAPAEAPAAEGADKE